MSYESDMTIEQFCAKHDACSEGQDWALEHCETMQDVWRLAKPEWLLWVAFCDGVLPLSKLVEAAVFFTRKIIHRIDDPDILELWAAIEKFMAGALAVDQLRSAHARALDAKKPVRRPPEFWAMLHLAAMYTEQPADIPGARSARTACAENALSRVEYAIVNADSTTTRGSVWAEQAAWFREHTEPCFKI